MHAYEPPLDCELAERLAYCRPARAETFRQRALGGQRLPWRKASKNFGEVALDHVVLGMPPRCALSGLVREVQGGNNVVRDRSQVSSPPVSVAQKSSTRCDPGC